MNIIEVKDLCKTYIVDKQSNNVWQNVNLKVEEGEFVTVMGPSGSGKSTLLYTVSGMDSATAGEVIFDGEGISGKSEKEMSKIRLVWPLPRTIRKSWRVSRSSHCRSSSPQRSRSRLISGSLVMTGS